ncbi:MAG: VCBS repeat-containing protein, partial [Acidobacteriota bacterium]
STTAFGISTDVPVPGDYDGDGKDDVAVYRNGTWYVLRSTAGLLIQPFGIASDKPIPSQYIP